MSLRISVLALLACLVLPVTNALAFGLDDVAARTEKLATATYQKPGSKPPEVVHQDETPLRRAS
jgi:hypothetical protein